MRGRRSFTVLIGRLLQRIPAHFLRFIELPLIAFSPKRDAAMIFLLALPRGGSTLSFQVLCHALRARYFSNIWNLLYQLPLIGGYFSILVTRFHCSNFVSQYGFVRGLGGPAEGLRFWDWWFGYDLLDSLSDKLPQRARRRRITYIKKVFDVLTRADRPFISAYLGHSLVPDDLRSAFPGAIYIRIRREPVANALSLLRAMQKNHRSWFSIVPRECQDLGCLSEHERVACQVYWLNRRLDDAEVSSRCLTVWYESLCDNPASELDRIRDYCSSHGINPPVIRSLPLRFNHRVPDLNSDDDAVKLADALSDLEKKYGSLSRS